jgi:hypothetical protein
LTRRTIKNPLPPPTPPTNPEPPCDLPRSDATSEPEVPLPSPPAPPVWRGRSLSYGEEGSERSVFVGSEESHSAIMVLQLERPSIEGDKDVPGEQGLERIVSGGRTISRMFFHRDAAEAIATTLIEAIGKSLIVIKYNYVEEPCQTPRPDASPSETSETSSPRSKKTGARKTRLLRAG